MKNLFNCYAFQLAVTPDPPTLFKRQRQLIYCNVHEAFKIVSQNFSRFYVGSAAVLVLLHPILRIPLHADLLNLQFRIIFRDGCSKMKY